MQTESHSPRLHFLITLESWHMATVREVISKWIRGEAVTADSILIYSIKDPLEMVLCFFLSYTSCFHAGTRFRERPCHEVGRQKRLKSVSNLGFCICFWRRWLHFEVKLPAVSVGPLNSQAGKHRAALPNSCRPQKQGAIFVSFVFSQPSFTGFFIIVNNRKRQKWQIQMAASVFIVCVKLSNTVYLPLPFVT